MNNHTHNHSSNYTIKDFLPLIIILTIIFLFVLCKQYLFGYNFNSAMYDFMGSFFLLLSIFKIYNLTNFVHAYQMYDIIAKRSDIYAYAYPFIELILGLFFLFRFQLLAANWLTLIIMTISSIGVYQQLAKGEKIICACLGTVFKIPMTYVTLAEDLIMGLMAAIMLFKF